MQPYLIASSDHVIFSIGSFEVVWSNRHSRRQYVTGTLLCLDPVKFFDNVSGKVNGSFQNKCAFYVPVKFRS